MAGVGSAVSGLLLLLIPLLIAGESIRLSKERGPSALLIPLIPVLWLLPLIFWSAPIKLIRPDALAPAGWSAIFATISILQLLLGLVGWRRRAVPLWFAGVAVAASLPMTALTWLALEDAAGGGAL